MNKTLKKTCMATCISLVAFVTQSVNAQSLNMRVGDALSFQNVYENGENVLDQTELYDHGSYTVSTAPVFGYRAALTYEFKLSEIVGLETGLQASTKGFKIKEIETYSFMGMESESSVTTTIKNHVVDIPILVKLGFDVGNVRMYGSIGPFVGLALFGNAKWNREYKYVTSSYTQEEENVYQSGYDLEKLEDRLNFGGIVAYGLEVKSIYFELGYSYSAINPSYFAADRVVNHQVGLSLGYKFRKQTIEE